MQHLIDEPEIEYIAGRPYPKVSPKLAHGLTQFACATVLKRCASGRGAVSTETRFRLLAGTELVPDVSYIDFARFKGLSNEQMEEPPFAPDIVVEVRSVSDRKSLIAKKTQQYLAHGSVLVLNVDPQSRSLTADTADLHAAVFAKDDRFRCAAVPWLQFEVAELFADLDIPH